jgi:periplasmic protein TonB
MIGRIPASIALGGLVTLALFIMIQKMVTPGDPAEVVAVRGPLIDFVRLKRDQDLALKRRAKPERPVKPRVAPPLPVAGKVNRPAPRADVPTMPVLEGPALGLAGPLGFMFPGEDMDALPLFRVPPQYPIRAERRGIEGWVDLAFTISKTGRVIDPEVIDGKPAGMFDQAARAAVMKWRYRPKVEHGSPIERKGVRVRIRFELRDDR